MGETLRQDTDVGVWLTIDTLRSRTKWGWRQSVGGGRDARERRGWTEGWKKRGRQTDRFRDREHHGLLMLLCPVLNSYCILEVPRLFQETESSLKVCSKTSCRLLQGAKPF